MAKKFGRMHKNSRIRAAYILGDGGISLTIPPYIIEKMGNEIIATTKDGPDSGIFLCSERQNRSLKSEKYEWEYHLGKGPFF